MDFTQLFKLKSMWTKFTSNHPKFPSFMMAVRDKGIPEQTNIDITFTYPDGTRIKGGIIVQPSDIELFNSLIEFSKNQK